ncbi:MAG: DUF262 domain-containing protein [Desulfobacterium sp.]|nr:DUF262 domain-containing protein [Desulfobacterium sp.]
MDTSPITIPEVKPEIVFIFNLLDEVRAGKLRIPKFQRSYVWRREQMTELLDSIYHQFPIGSLLVWETEERVSSRDWIGPLKVPEATGGLSAHLLDGQQRLSTLSGVLTPFTDTIEQKDDEEDPERWKIWFDIEKSTFEHFKSPDTQSEPRHFPMWKLLDTVAFLAESQRILQDGGDKGEAYVQKIQVLLRRFQSYKVPVIRIKNTGLNQAVEIFARLNSKGQAMSADEMVSALSYREDQDFSLSEHIDKILEELDSHGFGRIERVIVLRSLLAALGEDIYRTDWTRFTDQKRSEVRDKLPRVVGQTQEALVRATAFLHEQGVHNHRLLPYAMQLVVLSAFFGACPEPTSKQRVFLRRWFWVSSFTGWFASGNPSRVAALIREFREHVAREPEPVVLENMRLNEPAQPFPKTFDMRSARGRTLLLVILSQEPCDNKGDKVEEPWRRIGEHGPNAIGYIASGAKDRTLRSSPANRILKFDVKDGSQAKNWLVQLGDEEDSKISRILKSHAIPSKGLPLLKQNDADGFLKARLEYCIDLERKFMESNDVTPPLDREMRPSPIDTGESDLTSRVNGLPKFLEGDLFR